MAITLLEAARRTGKTKPTLLKAIGRGRLSASKDESGQWQIDPAELFRVYPPSDSGTVPEKNTVIASRSQEIEALKRERDLLQRQAGDLGRRLDESEQERRAITNQLTALLTDQRGQEAEHRSHAPQEARGGRLARAWAVLRGKG